jgi:hypothetical protein
MRVNIVPILSADVEKTTQAFFTPEFASQSLGQTGQWLGVESQRLGLKGPVDKSVLDHLLQGRSPTGTVQPGGDWRPADRPAGWKITFDLDWRHNTLWATGNEEIRHLAEFTHGTSVKECVEQLDQVVRRAAGFEPTDRAGAVFASFRSGTGEGQVPGLRSTVIVPQGHLRDDGSLMTFPARVISECGVRLNQAYLCEFVPRAVHAFGSVGAPTAQVPKKLFKPLAQDPRIAGAAAKEGKLVFTGEDLFAQWKRQAELKGFGPPEVTDLLHHARLHANSYCKPLNPEVPGATEMIKGMVQKLWAYCLSPNSHSHSQNEHSQGHRHSI